jgi:hypothetical protein
MHRFQYRRGKRRVQRIPHTSLLQNQELPQEVRVTRMTEGSPQRREIPDSTGTVKNSQYTPIYWRNFT